MLNKKAKMDSKSFSDKHDKQIEQIEKLLDEKMKKPFANTLEEFFENPLSFALRPQDLLKWMEEETLLTHAVKMQKNLAAAALLHMGVDPNIPNKKGVTPISAAAHKGNIQIMKILIQYNASVNALNTSGSTALIQASHFGHVEAVRLLLQNNASADFHNLKGTTALMRASQEGHVEISKLLITAGADVNRKNYEGMNALMLASQRGHGAMVMLLIKAPCAMDEQTQQGSTALMLACKRGHEECVKVLVSMGAEIYTRDNRNRTARDTATRRNHVNLLPWLDTQAQIKLHQEYQLMERTQFLTELKNAYEEGRLRIDLEERNCLHLLSACQRREESSSNNKSSSVVRNEGNLGMNIDYNNNNNNNNNNNRNNNISSSSSSSSIPPHLTIPFSVTSNIVRNNSGPVNTNTNILTWQQNNAYSSLHQDQDFFDAFIHQSIITSSSSSSSSLTIPTSSITNNTTTSHIDNNNTNHNYNNITANHNNTVTTTNITTPLTTTTTTTATPLTRNEREIINANKIAAATAAAVAQWDITPDMVNQTMPSIRNHPFVTSVLKPVSESNYQPYEWSILLIRSLTLPTGIFDLITEFLPLPRVWSWTLEVLKKRCSIVPQQCATDLSILMDEILTDANIFKGSNQKLLIMKLNANPQIYPLLMSEWKMPAPLINQLRVWADVQSILNRAVLEYDFNLKLPMIRSMHTVCTELHRWSQSRGSAYRVLMDAVGSVSVANELLLKLNPMARGRKMHLGHLDDFTGSGCYGLGTDSCRSSGLGSADDDMSVVGTETVMDQDTETELHNDLDADDTQDEDSDAEGGGNGNEVTGGNTGVGGVGAATMMILPSQQQQQQQTQQQHHQQPQHHHHPHHYHHSHQMQLPLPQPPQQSLQASHHLLPMTATTPMLTSNNNNNNYHINNNIFHHAGGFSNGAGSGGFNNGTGSGGFNNGAGSGGFNNGARSGGFNNGAGSGGFNNGAGSGGMGSNNR